MLREDPTRTAAAASLTSSASQRDMASPDAGGAATPAVSDAGEFPNEAEAALLARLPSAIAASCDRADSDGIPTYGDVAYTRVTLFPLPVAAGVSCLTDLNRVIYWESTNRGAIDSVLFSEIGKRRVPAGSCDDHGRAHQEWEAGPLDGRLMCYSSATAPELWWTYEDAPILGIATRRDGDSDALLRWWRAIGRLLRD